MRKRRYNRGSPAMLDGSIRELESRSLTGIRPAQSPKELESARVDELGRKGGFRAAILADSLPNVLLAPLRELSNESVYRRHLAAHARENSGDEWRRFSDQRLRARFARAKCC